tara:strand:+ start:3900 stop:4586 length:687 start_codon:yes stop_codon:yes gene_type:complete
MSDIHDNVWSIPYHTKGNCYVFALGPTEGPGGYYRSRMFKSRPGNKCEEWKHKDYDFNNCSETIKRVLCDNPDHVEKVSHDEYLYKDIEPDHHLMVALLSYENPNSDYHFLRRIPIQTVFTHWNKFRKNMPDNCKQQLLDKRPKYIWAHQQGWSNSGIKIHDSENNLITDPKKATFKYKKQNYSIYCGMFKVRTHHATVSTEYDIFMSFTELLVFVLLILLVIYCRFY